jgi:hypothetical protein
MPFKCNEISLNTTEQVEMIEPPAPDIWNVLRRGAITKDWNTGLRNPQAKLMTVDTYNSGCSNPWGCISSGGYRCPGSKPKVSPIQGMYDFLQAPLLTGTYKADLEYHPPAFMEGIKAGGPNSVTGWSKVGKEGQKYLWESMNQIENPTIHEGVKCYGNGK